MTIADRQAALATMSPAQLREEWQRLYKSAPPSVSTDLLLAGIAYRLQEKQFGGLKPAIKRALARHLEAGTTSAEPRKPASISLRPGTRLVRTWRERTINVLVLDDGFEFDGRRCRSLSEIACEVTGAKWSGPRFFGLARARHA